MVECYNEKVENIKYLEEKWVKSKADVCRKVTERRREDVRDQMMELSAKPALNMSQVVWTLTKVFLCFLSTSGIWSDCTWGKGVHNSPIFDEFKTQSA